MANSEDLLIEQNRGLVKSIVNQFRPKNDTEFEEYEQAGLIGLMMAIRKHDPKKGKLTTIAFYYIAGEISKFIKREKCNIIAKQNDYDLSKEYYLTEDPVSYYMSNLSNLEQQIIELRLKGYTFKEIGSIVGNYSKEYARLVYKSIIKKISNYNG